MGDRQTSKGHNDDITRERLDMLIYIGQGQRQCSPLETTAFPFRRKPVELLTYSRLTPTLSRAQNTRRNDACLFELHVRAKRLNYPTILIQHADARGR